MRFSFLALPARILSHRFPRMRLVQMHYPSLLLTQLVLGIYLSSCGVSEANAVRGAARRDNRVTSSSPMKQDRDRWLLATWQARWRDEVREPEDVDWSALGPMVVFLGCGLKMMIAGCCGRSAAAASCLASGDMDWGVCHLLNFFFSFSLSLPSSLAVWCMYVLHL